MMKLYVVVFDRHGYFMYSRKFKYMDLCNQFCVRAERFGLTTEVMYYQ